MRESGKLKESFKKMSIPITLYFHMAPKGDLPRVLCRDSPLTSLTSPPWHMQPHLTLPAHHQSSKSFSHFSFLFSKTRSYNWDSSFFFSSSLSGFAAGWHEGDSSLCSKWKGYNFITTWCSQSGFPHPFCCLEYSAASWLEFSVCLRGGPG